MTEQQRQEQIKSIQTDIASAQEKLKQLEKCEVVKWEPKGGDYTIFGDGGVMHTNPLIKWSKNGLQYPTQKQAEKARDAMLTHNRLLAYIAEFNEGWEADWNNYNQGKYYVEYNHQSGKYYKTYTLAMENVNGVYMSEQCVEGLVEKLNSGEVEL